MCHVIHVYNVKCFLVHKYYMTDFDKPEAILIRDVKQRSNFRTSNYMFKFGIVTFDIRFRLALT